MLSPLDSRYSKIIEPLAKIYSQDNYYFELLKFELWYFDFFVTRHLKKRPRNHSKIDSYITNGAKDKALILENIKKVEKDTRHDIKAVEYYAKMVLCDLGVNKNLEFLHFGLTSQDVVSVVNNMLLIRAFDNVITPKFNTVIYKIKEKAQTYDIPFVGRTHGQKANITTTGKELKSFMFRLRNVGEFMPTKHYVKFGGALGDFLTLKNLMPRRFMYRFAEDFLAHYCTKNHVQYTLIPADFATQTDYHKLIVDSSHKLHEAACVMQDISKDMWSYCSMGHMKLRNDFEEVGSSTMPQKSNPIHFENCEGNLQSANVWFELFMEKFPQSRLQRDLSDSTVLRNVGVALGHFYLAMTELCKGFDKVIVDETFCMDEVSNNFQVLGEYVQLALKLSGDDAAYEKLKHKLRGLSSMNRTQYQQMIDTLDVKPSVKILLLKVNPVNLIKG